MGEATGYALLLTASMVRGREAHDARLEDIENENEREEDSVAEALRLTNSPARRYEYSSRSCGNMV